MLNQRPMPFTCRPSTQSTRTAKSHWGPGGNTRAPALRERGQARCICELLWDTVHFMTSQPFLTCFPDSPPRDAFLLPDSRRLEFKQG